METLASFLFASGRLAPKPFVFGALLVYLASFLSQFLLAAPVIGRGGVIPFVAVQLVTVWSWYALHAMRLRDSGRSTGMALAISILYGLGIVLLLLIVTLLAAVAPEKATGLDPVAAGFLEFFLLVYLIAMLAGDPNLGVFGYVMLGVLALIIVPMLISVVFSVWAALRPRQPAPVSESEVRSILRHAGQRTSDS